MGRFIKRMAVMGIALGGAAFMGTYLYADNPTAQNQGAAQAADNAVDSQTAKDVHARLASIINTGVTRDKFNNLVGSFDKGARDRITAENYKDFDKLNASIDQFRKDFKDKYNQDFDLKSAAINFAISRGSDNNQVTVTLPAMPNAEANGVNNPITGNTSAATPENQATMAHQNNTDVNNISNGLNSTLTMLHENELGNGWRLQVPDNLTARGLVDSLTSQLTALSNMKDRWPSDVNDAYLKVSKHILSSIENPQNTNVTVENR